MDLNSVTLTGNLTRDPELRELPSGQKVTSLRLASKTFGDKTVFTDISAWDKLAELVNEYLSKGSQVAVVGRLDYREWETTDGQKRSAHSVVANSVKFPPKAAAAPASEAFDLG